MSLINVFKKSSETIIIVTGHQTIKEKHFNKKKHTTNRSENQVFICIRNVGILKITGFWRIMFLNIKNSKLSFLFACLVITTFCIMLYFHYSMVELFAQANRCIVRHVCILLLIEKKLVFLTA